MRSKLPSPIQPLSTVDRSSADLSPAERRLRRREAEVALLATAGSTPEAVKHSKRGPLPDASGTGTPTTITIEQQSPEGLTRYLLQRLPGVLYVERQHAKRRGLQTLQSVHFRDAQGFAAWCDEDPLRFDKPLVVARVRQQGCGLWQVDASAGVSTDAR